MPTIAGAMPCLNKAPGSKSFLMLKGTGFAEDQPAGVTYNGMKWTGSVIWASGKGRFGMVKLTRDGLAPGIVKPEPKDTQEVLVTVEGTTEPVTVDLYTE